jgi:hypothetical protein
MKIPVELCTLIFAAQWHIVVPNSKSLNDRFLINKYRKTEENHKQNN